MRKELPPQDLLRRCLKYVPTTGGLWWLERTPETFEIEEPKKAERAAQLFNIKFCDTPAFTTKNDDGYLLGQFNKRIYRAHRIIMRIVYGTDPIQVDHQDGDRSNNRLVNLIDTTNRLNAMNRCLGSNNVSGFHGVHYNSKRRRWVAFIYVDKKRVHLGWFMDQGEAVAARQRAEIEYGYHTNHGRSA